MPTTAEQQLILELINRARSNPAGEYDELVPGGVGATPLIEQALTYFGVDLTVLQNQFNSYDAQAPLAYSEILETSAEAHNDLMIETGQQSHYLPGEGGIVERFQDAGYDQIQSIAENIYAYAYDEIYAHAGFYIDWGGNNGTGIQDPAGHRDAILSGVFTEVGIAWEAGSHPSSSIGPYVTTQHFGTTFDYESQLLGVIFDDGDADDFYDIGEGMGGVTITVTDGQVTYTTTSWASGGYQLVVPDGIYTVIFSGGGLEGQIVSSFTMDGENVKIDGIADEAQESGEVIAGDNGDDTLSGTLFADQISGGLGDDRILGGGGDDDLHGNGGSDTVYGDEGNDLIRGGRGEDQLFGDAGEDSIRSQKNGDIVFGGAGNDNIKGGGGNDELHGDAGDDFIKGGTRRDVLFGGDGNDTMAGNSFDDELYGGDGNDRLNAGGDDDVLDGGAGNDLLKGGSGADTFVFDVGHDSDTIVDFDTAVDQLEISAALAAGQSATQIAASAQTLVNGDTLLDFGNGNEILFTSAIDVETLASAIDIV